MENVKLTPTQRVLPFRVADHIFKPPGKEQSGMRLSVFLSALATGLVLNSATAADLEKLVYVPNSTKKVCQLTGNFDRANGSPTLSRTGKRFGVAATDLGSSFDHKGRLYFLFGDT